MSDKIERAAPASRRTFLHRLGAITAAGLGLALIPSTSQAAVRCPNNPPPRPNGCDNCGGNICCWPIQCNSPVCGYRTWFRCHDACRQVKWCICSANACRPYFCGGPC